MWQENLICCKARAKVIFIVDPAQPGLLFRMYLIWLLTISPHHRVTWVPLSTPGFLVTHLINKLTPPDFSWASIDNAASRGECLCLSHLLLLRLRLEGGASCACTIFCIQGWFGKVFLISRSVSGDNVVVMPSCAIPLSFLNILFSVTVVERATAHHGAICWALNGAFECLQLSVTRELPVCFWIWLPSSCPLPGMPLFPQSSGRSYSGCKTFSWVILDAHGHS